MNRDQSAVKSTTTKIARNAMASQCLQVSHVNANHHCAVKEVAMDNACHTKLLHSHDTNRAQNKDKSFFK